MIPYSRQQVSEEDIDAVVSVLRSDYLTQGQVVTQFEKAVADYCQAKHCVAASSATAALHLACLALELTENDRVWVTALSFVASANCARYCGAELDFVDIEASTGLISVAALADKLNQAALQKRLPQLLIVVHLAGQSCDMKAISQLCRRYDIRIIEDASHALGGNYEELPVGSCRYSDLCIFSFHPVKPITTGEGGAITTNNPSLAKRARLYMSHGIERDQSCFINKPTGSWYYEQQVLGYNYRLSDIHAALGLSQLKRLDKRTRERRELARCYQDALQGLPLSLLTTDHGNSAWHLFIIRVDKQERRALFEQLTASGFCVNLHYMPIPAQPYYVELGYDAADYPAANAYAETAISLPLFSGMNLEVIDQVVGEIHSFFRAKKTLS